MRMGQAPEKVVSVNIHHPRWVAMVPGTGIEPVRGLSARGGF
jgi:hypothetical protein